MKNLEYSQIELSDNVRYRQHLALCKDIPADLCTGFIWGYSSFAPTERAYADGLCWQHQELHGEKFEFAPVGDWDKADWPKLFDKHVTPGTVFDFVPGCLKEQWEALFPGRFTITTNRNDWDYIYDLDEFDDDTKEKRRVLKRFSENYRHTVEPITSDNVGDVIKLNAMAEQHIRDRLGASSNLEELYDDDRAMLHVLRNWDAFDSVEGFIIRVNGQPISFLIWDVINEYIFTMFGKNLYDYAGVNTVAMEELCSSNLKKGRKKTNNACDAGIEGLRKSKMLRNPERLLEKYKMVWLG